MYDVDPLTPDIRAQVDALPRRAFDDYEAAIAFIRDRPVDGPIIEELVQPDFLPRLQNFGLGRGRLVYTTHERRITVVELSFMQPAR